MRSTTLALIVSFAAASGSACVAAGCSSSGDAATTTNDGGPTNPNTLVDGGGEETDGQGPGVDGGNDANTALQGTLTVLSLNLHCLKTEGTSFTTNDARFGAIAKVVKDEGVDVILAQEVCISPSQNARTMFVAALNAMWGLEGTSWSSEIGFAHKAWVGTPDEADEHVGIFARGTLTDPHENVHRAQAALRRVTLNATFTASAKSGMATTTVAPTFPVRLSTVHFEFADATARAGQAREAASFAMVDADDPKLHPVVPITDNNAATGGAGGVLLPIVMGGDFNAENGTDATKALTDYGFVEKSATAPNTGIDHIFAHRSAPLSAVATKELFTGTAAVSDHPGVLVRFEAAAAKSVKLTRITANGAAFASPLAVRGDSLPLSWERGWPAYARSGTAIPMLVTSELASKAFAYKFLQNDTTWATGGNVTGTGETDNTSSPSF